MFVVAIALVVAMLLSAGGRRHMAVAGFDFLALFLVLFFATWALGAWFRPVGPILRGVH